MLKGGAVPEKSATPLAEPPQPILADKNKLHTKGKDIPGSRWNMIKVAAWNVRGLNGMDHQRAVEHLRTLWNTLQSVAADADEPWLVLGDFNAVIDDSEVCGHAADTSASMNEFRQCILDSGLIHLPFTGCPFTWHNCSTGSRSLWKRLDRMLVNEAWLDKWPNASYISALPSTSDHSPLIIHSEYRVHLTEIKDAIFDITEDSAPGPDGYTSASLKQPGQWLAKKSAAIGEFFTSGKLLKQINATLLVLIPKVQMPSQVSDYRPISCCNVIYKAITKIMVKRMQKPKNYLPDTIRPDYLPGALSKWTFKKPMTRCNGTSFWRADIPSIRVLKHTLSEFAELSGLKVNPNKSQIILSRAVQQEKQQMIGILGINWTRLCQSGLGPDMPTKEEGGLGFHNILVINKALMLKHLWKIVQNDRHSIWVDWILHHRLHNNSLWTFNGSTGYMASTRTTIYRFPEGPEVTGWPLNSFLLDCNMVTGAGQIIMTLTSVRLSLNYHWFIKTHQTLSFGGMPRAILCKICDRADSASE
ncbi:UNVERIFIED_CONTAM: hypothetical protein Sradi_6452200 [Sesamum radiatum]|uniref:Endonuclease/exonuclease/phosphatase domain-containing protein n=1 Tax=Sesamum radiatum TaxID=300843 RepID=A0AAW2K4F9_SESRA